jgi:DivIVA domain-containing protein
MGEVMPLSPDDVSNKRFTPVRLREGYDMGEVDQFLDEVESELARLTKENEELRSALSRGEGGGASLTAVAASAPERDGSESEPAHQDGSVPGTTTPAESIRVETVPQASHAAARLLEIATRNADQLVDEARSDADKILTDARSEAERLEAEARSTSDKVEADARSRAQLLDSETTERRTALFGALEAERGRLNNEVENLRSFEREYRSRLKSYFTQQLEALEDTHDAAGPEDAGEPAPKRLRAILGDDEG